MVGEGIIAHTTSPAIDTPWDTSNQTIISPDSPPKEITYWELYGVPWALYVLPGVIGAIIIVVIIREKEKKL